MKYAETCPCGSETFHLVHIEEDAQIRVDCTDCGNVAAVGNNPTLGPRIGEGDS